MEYNQKHPVFPVVFDLTQGFTELFQITTWIFLGKEACHQESFQITRKDVFIKIISTFL